MYNTINRGFVTKAKTKTGFSLFGDFINWGAGHRGGMGAILSGVMLIYAAVGITISKLTKSGSIEPPAAHSNLPQAKDSVEVSPTIYKMHEAEMPVFVNGPHTKIENIDSAKKSTALNTSLGSHHH